MLDTRFEFPIIVMAEPIEDIQRFLAEDPAPGIDPIPDAKVLRLEPVEGGDGEEVQAIVEMSVESFVRNGIQYGEDAYDVLAKVKAVAGGEVAAAALEFIKSSPDLTTTIIDTTAGEIMADQWPANPKL